MEKTIESMGLYLPIELIRHVIAAMLFGGQICGSLRLQQVHDLSSLRFIMQPRESGQGYVLGQAGSSQITAGTSGTRPNGDGGNGIRGLRPRGRRLQSPATSAP